VLVPIILLLHKSGGGIGSEGLAAPQAGLMYKTATGIIGGMMPWHYIVIGMLFAVALILIGSPSPMLIAVGMYLPFTTTAAIFVGGLIKANLPVRLVGAVTTPEDAKVATGVAGSGANRLRGRGDFLLAARQEMVRFQAAYASDEEIRRLIRTETGRWRHGDYPRHAERPAQISPIPRHSFSGSHS